MSPTAIVLPASKPRLPALITGTGKRATGRLVEFVRWLIGFWWDFIENPVQPLANFGSVPLPPAHSGNRSCCGSGSQKLEMNPTAYTSSATALAE